MKTTAQINFDRVIKEGFHEILKPLGFKKKALNFYLPLTGLGQIINIQKSTFYSKDHIHFTINVGIFVPEFWAIYYQFKKEVPAFPAEPDCAIRLRIGSLKTGHDTWYDIVADSNVEDIIAVMRENVRDYILPYLEKAKSKAGIIQLLEDKSQRLSVITFTRLIIYGEYKETEKAKAEYEALMQDKYIYRKFSHELANYKEKYGL